jgi:hypothetical protein
MQRTVVARKRDHNGRRTVCIVRHATGYEVAVLLRFGTFCPLEASLYDAYEAAWARLCQECGRDEQEG